MIRLASYANSRVQLWITPCVVTMPPPGSDTLCVPSNERLVGTQFSHFPVGGPTPIADEIGESSIPPDANRSPSWMLYQCESIDGVVTELGGTTPSDIHRRAPILRGGPRHPVRCHTGTAVRVPAAGSLAPFFPGGLILAVAPFWPHRPAGTSVGDWRRKLASAYAETFALVERADSLAVPLLGAGARGAPVGEAADVASGSVARYLGARGDGAGWSPICFAVQDDDVAEVLDGALRRDVGVDPDR